MSQLPEVLLPARPRRFIPEVCVVSVEPRSWRLACRTVQAPADALDLRKSFISRAMQATRFRQRLKTAQLLFVTQRALPVLLQLCDEFSLNHAIRLGARWVEYRVLPQASEFATGRALRYVRAESDLFLRGRRAMAAAARPAQSSRAQPIS